MFYNLPMNNNDKWDIRFLRLAREISTYSKDPSTQTGAVIVRPDRTICSTGFNGFAKKMPDVQSYYDNREEKYSRIVHCEMNAMIHSYERMDGYVLYTWPFASCDRCAVHMIQAGITRFVFPELPEDKRSRWEESMTKTKKYFAEAGVEITEVPMENLNV